MESHLDGLITKLEKSTGPDRELDAHIWLEVTPGATRKQGSYVHTASGRTCEIDETRIASGRLIVVPEYTASIDIALTLIPSKPDLLAWKISFAYNGAPFDAWIYNGKEFEGRHPTSPAIALVIACLRARAAAAGAKE